MDQVTQQNAALVEEAAAAAQALQDQAHELEDVVRIFKLGSHSGTSSLRAQAQRLAQVSAPRQSSSRPESRWRLFSL
jgi:methyl-accepting chemotaxis protein-2 (aspartate sensor receptor)